MEEENSNPSNNDTNSNHNQLFTEPATNCWHMNITTIDLSAQNMNYIDETIHLPINLLELNLSHNNFVAVPIIVLYLKKLQRLDLSHNAIEYFDDIPQFCHTLQRLDLSTNNLLWPPTWIWTQKPKHLSQLNLSFNTNITNSFFKGYLLILLQYKTPITEIDIYNCGFGNNDTALLSTFTKAKTINFGNDESCYQGSNIMHEIPSKGLEKCCDIEHLNLSNTCVYIINKNIDIFKNLRELNLSYNNIHSLPDEFCNLGNLETCILSTNKILYLPEDIYKLKKLFRLHIDNNELCMLPEKLLQIPNLQVLDLYNNHLNEVVEDYTNLQKFDMAQNYLDEPDNVDYLEKKKRLRQLNLHENRWDGRKPEVVQPELEYSSTESDEKYYRGIHDEEIPEDNLKPEKDRSRSSSPEDWDSDAHWVPHDYKTHFYTPTQAWVHYVNRKLREGNFCPIDAHVVPISAQVYYFKQLNPTLEVEYVGQFDDYSSDES